MTGAIPLLVALACSGTGSAPSTVASVPAGPRIEVEHAWVRAMPPGSRTSAAYLVLRNPGNQEAAVVGVHTDVARDAELHTHVLKDGVAAMRQVQKSPCPRAEWPSSSRVATTSC